MALIVGLLIFVQLLRAKLIDLFALLVISVCFVMAIVTTGMWGAKSGR